MAIENGRGFGRSAPARPDRRIEHRGGLARLAIGLVAFGLLAALVATPSVAAQDVEPEIGPPDNDKILQTQTGLVVAHNIGMVAGFSWEPISSAIGETAANLTNFGLKFVPPILEAPAGVTVKPAGEDCNVGFTLPQQSDGYTNLFGLFDVDPIEPDWGLLSSGSAPRVQHANSDVSLTVAGSGIPADSIGDGPADITLTEGAHTYVWTAQTQISDFFDVILPAGLQVLLVFVEAKYGELIGNYLSRKGITKQAYKNALQVAANIAIDAGVTTADVATDLSRPSDPSARQVQVQSVVVQDIHTPTIEFDPAQPDETTGRIDRVMVEAVDFGGIAFDRIEADLRSHLVADDPCGLAVRVTGDWTEALVPISDVDHEMTWTVEDNPASVYAPGVDPTDSVTQFVRIEDTQAPILVPPPSRVIESTVPVPSGVPTLGSPLVADLADPAPSVSVNNNRDFAVDTRTLVEWSATDSSGNRSTANQTITVKTPGTNTAPVARENAASTLTSQPVDIVLTATDRDRLQGSPDPLTMRIEQRPEFGEFVAPLYPYFIEDYRMSPVGPFGGWDDDGRYSRFQDFLKGEYCDQSPAEPIPVDWVYAPTFFQVRDDGTTFIRDQFWTCAQIRANTPNTSGRISVWDRDRNYLGQTTNIQDDSRIPTFEIDDQYLYTVGWLNRGSATNRMSIQRTPQDMTNGVQADLWEICECPGTGVPSPSPVSFSTLVNGRPDPTGDLLYVIDERTVSVWDARPESLVNGNKPVYLANLAGTRLEPILGANGTGGSRGHNVALDSEGNVYVAGSGRDRIHKITRSFFADDGSFVAGEYVGWMGKCTSGSERRCDEEAQVSRGFSCTDTTCSADSTAGSEQGQFDDPSYVAIDPNDIVYVADHGNERIQRFSPDGTFAGEAQSVAEGVTSDGTFVLGNFGPPRHVTVNSNQFFILEGDASESFLHVFESSPIHPESVTADSATVTYVSDFVSGPRDSFTFVASDGLVDSRPATVSIDIARADRPPVLAGSAVNTVEDQSTEVDLVGDDPDGINGRDFLGLDTVSFVVAGQPEHGSVAIARGSCETGAEASHTGCLTYTPEPNFSGNDEFTISAVDSRGLESESAAFTVDVAPVPDVPNVAMEPFSASRGFPTLVTFDYADPDESSDETHVFSYAFDAAGDQSDRTGTLTPGGELGFELFAGQTKTAGINATSGPGRGTVGIPHIFDEARTYVVSGCASDGTEEEFVCTDDVEVDVIEAAELAISVTDPQSPDPDPGRDGFEPFQPTVAPGARTEVQVRIENLLPSSYPGLDATNINVDIANTLGVTLRPSSGCAELTAGDGLRCSVDALKPADVADLTIEVSAPTDGFPAVQSLLDIVVDYEDAGAARQGRTTALIKIDWPDGDGDQMPDAYESANGLNPELDDALGDIDGDGVSNVDEYFETMANDGVPIERAPLVDLAADDVSRAGADDPSSGSGNNFNQIFTIAALTLLAGAVSTGAVLLNRRRLGR